MNKLYVGGFILILIVLGVWQYTKMVEENGELTQANATLKKTVEDSEKENKKLKAVAELNATTVAKASKAKNVLNTYALKLAHELEILKNENDDIKKWSVNGVPSVLVDRLLGFSGENPKNGLSESAEGVIKADSRTKIKVQNENLYNYANDLKSALRSCNAD